MIFDSHTHVNFAAFKNDRKDVISRALDQNTWLVNVGTQIDTSRIAVELANDFSGGVFAAVGLHPWHTLELIRDEEESHFQSRAESFEETIYEELVKNSKVVGIGECGLDYYRLPKDRDPGPIKQKQREEFIKQLRFAKKHFLPAIIHCRDLPTGRQDAYEDLLAILKSEYIGLPGVMHSFTDTWETAKKFLDLGLYIGLNGILTFDKTGQLKEVCERAPIDKILTETDAPYLAPPPFRGKRNEPAFVRFVTAKIAEIRGLSMEKAEDQIFLNAKKLFKINL